MSDKLTMEARNYKNNNWNVKIFLSDASSDEVVKMMEEFATLQTQEDKKTIEEQRKEIERLKGLLKKEVIKRLPGMLSGNSAWEGYKTANNL